MVKTVEIGTNQFFDQVRDFVEALTVIDRNFIVPSFGSISATEFFRDRKDLQAWINELVRNHRIFLPKS